MRTLILNSSNIVDGTNNSVLEYNFPGGNVVFKKGHKLALASLQMYYSTFNITSANKNNTFNYTWVNGVSYSVVFPDGFYDILAINNFLHFTMVQNKHYLVNIATGDFIYFITLNANPNAYAIETNCFLMNTTLFPPATFALPAGATWVVPSVQAICPMLQVLNNDFQSVIGYNAGYYPQGSSGAYAPAVIGGVSPAFTQIPAYTTTQTFLGDLVPQITPLSSYTLSCSLINNNYAVPNSLLYSFSPQGVFGSQFTIAPNQYVFIDIYEGQYNTFTIRFTDQNNRPVSIEDPNYVLLLIISEPSDNLGL
jgi:hypothetical protein